MAESFQVQLQGAGHVTALNYSPADGGSSRATLILGHGAGAGQTSSFMVRAATGLSERGIEVVTFNFPYIEQRRRVPDQAAKLETCYRAVIASVRGRRDSPDRQLFIGGKSLGGRIASHLAAADEELSPWLSGLLCLGYPLHPPGQPGKLRAAHLGQIKVPILIVQGSRDNFGTPDELHAAFPQGAAVEIFVVEGGDHSLRVSRNAAVQDPVDAAVLDRVQQWISTSVAESRVPPSRSPRA